MKTNFSLKKILILVIVLSITSKVFSQTTDSGFKTLETITVISRNIKSNDSITPYSLTSIRGDAISFNKYRTTSEALMGSSGVFIQKTNHGGGSAFIRGLTGNETLILIDGIRFNNSTFRYGPNQYLNTIDVFSIDKIEVAKGIGSVEHGSDAIGGVINLLTKEAQFSNIKRLNFNSEIRIISAGMEQSNRSEIYYSDKKITINGGLSLRNFGDLVGGNGVGIQSPSGYQEKSYDVKIKIKPSESSSLLFASQLLNQIDVPIYHKIVLENYKTNQVDLQEREMQYLRYKKLFKNIFFSELIVTTSYQKAIEQRSNQKNNSVTYRKEADTVKTAGFSAEVISKPYFNWNINTGFDYYQDKVNSIANEMNPAWNSIVSKRGLYPNGAINKNSSLFQIHRIKLKRFELETGIRYNFLSIQIKDEILGNVNIKPSALVANFGINYSFKNNHQLYSSVSSGYRAPNIDDLGTLGIVDFRYELPTSNLKPEKSIHTEFGYKFMDKRWGLNISAFYMSLKDIITRVKSAGQIIDGYTVYTKQNIESAYIKGAEVSINYTMNSHIQIHSNATYTYGQNLTKQEPMRRIPPLFGQTDIMWSKGSCEIKFAYQFAGKQDRLSQGDKDDNRIGKLGTPEWNVFNLMTGFNYKKIKLNLGMLNIFNEKYKTHGSGIYGMGQSFYLSTKLSL